mmetsp:Transcript_62978/g.150022  ORF Transcript_62978/g.150022 Transcript_62978/m.150022 type:complete len:304 (+) Transcript_62978:120-1031(+)|eukprot:CAMPEP_0178415262 /NCGR_PEP_ID=MMETSP0689_2-20121128/23462_1 /TAXON_ID=160604 /ORGANISM="Amphidinium massartii, Strain CS-259" /LENGTH=303 /DNA_ID=CAMNT_0020036579 /DNA_START=39 /DNA_END=950 /DNA_ORIENTATION=-
MLPRMYAGSRHLQEGIGYVSARRDNREVTANPKDSVHLPQLRLAKPVAATDALHEDPWGIRQVARQGSRQRGSAAGGLPPLLSRNEAESEFPESGQSSRKRGRRVLRPVDDDEPVGSVRRSPPRIPSDDHSRGTRSPSRYLTARRGQEQVPATPSSPNRPTSGGRNDFQEKAKERVRQHRRRVYQEAEDAEAAKRMEELQKIERQEQALPQVEAFRRETARRAAARHKQERADALNAALEEEERNAERRERARMLNTPRGRRTRGSRSGSFTASHQGLKSREPYTQGSMAGAADDDDDENTLR